MQVKQVAQSGDRVKHLLKGSSKNPLMNAYYVPSIMQDPISMHYFILFSPATIIILTLQLRNQAFSSVQFYKEKESGEQLCMHAHTYTRADTHTYTR